MAGRKNLTSGRARRAIKMGGIASQVGSSYLWTSLRKPFLSAIAHEKELLDTHIKNAMRVVDGSKELRGAFLKLLQMLSMRDDILPGEALQILKLTQSGVPPMDYRTIAEQVKRELGKRPEQLFASFDTEAFAAASLGQVHRGRLKTGEDVAIKIQYPGVEDTVTEDLSNLNLLLKTLQAIASDVMGQKIDTRTIYDELEVRLKEELDYKREALSMQEFGKLLGDDPEVMIPHVFEEFSSRKILVMGYLDGYRLSDVLAPGVDRELKAWVAAKYYMLVWRQILEFGILHTDPHPGNYLVTYHPKLGVLDFGSIRRFSEELRKAYIKLGKAFLARDREGSAEALITMNYLDADQNPGPMLKVLDVVFEPWAEDREYDPADYDAIGKATEVSEITLESKLYKSPAHSVFLGRALIGLEGIIRQLGIPLNYRRMFEEAIARAEACA